jgi:hypothetical protein
MKKICLTLLFGFFFFNLSVNAQPPVRTETAVEVRERWARERQAARNEADELLKKILPAPVISPQRKIASERSRNLLYRYPTGEELKVISPDSEDQVKYAEFLHQPDTGLIKLAADVGCDDSKIVVVATARCYKYLFPGAGSAYSFRTANYRLRRLADIVYSDNSFQATGVLLNGIFVKLGDVPLEEVNLQTKGLSFLTNLKSDPDKFQELKRQLSKGIDFDGFQYRNKVQAAENTTYVLRSIAYRGSSPRNAEGIFFEEFDFDERLDVIVAFRLVSKDAEGNVTILWKKLLQKKSPMLSHKQASGK